MSPAEKLIRENLESQNPYLDLGNCGLDGTEPELELLAECEHLETLVFSDETNDIFDRYYKDISEDIPLSLGRITPNRFIILPSYFPKNLIKLHIRGDRFSEFKIIDILPLRKVIHLKYLDIRKNKISDITPLQELQCLETLSISNNPIRDFTPLQNLPALKELYATNCEIKDITPFKGLKSLTDLSLSRNPIKEINLYFLDSLPNLKKLYLYKTEIENVPKEIFDRDENCLPELRAYLESIAQEEERRELNEAKLIIVGVGKVGKSELVEALTEPNYTFVEGRKETKGIKIKEWHLACPREGETTDFRANIWDFAGQEIDYGTHQFFLTKNSVYVFVWENRIGEQESKFDYWLNIVSLLSQNAPILVVQNKIDENQTEINQQEWKNAFPNIVGFFKTSCKTGEGINALREAIEKQLFALPNTREIWNKYRVAVRTALENRTEDYISYKEYLQVCRQEGLPEKDAPFLAQQLHDIGVILHFADDISLKNTVVLKTDWAIDASYCLIDTKKVQLGRFQKQDLENVWADTRFDEKYDFLLNLIQRFELIFQFQDTPTYIVPEGLSPESPIPVNSSASLPANLLRFEYHYKFMPKGILSRFICRVHQHIKGEMFWKYGVVLEYEQDTQASVTLWEIDKILRIEIVGKSASKLLAIIRSHIDHIHNTLKNPPLEEKIPCVCVECKTSSKPYLHDHQVLRKFQEKGRETKECNKSAEDVKIAQLLEGIEDSRQAREKPLHTLIQKALLCLEQATYADYFAEMDKLPLPAHLKGLYSELKMKFISEEKNWSFTQKLATFAREANQTL